MGVEGVGEKNKKIINDKLEMIKIKVTGCRNESR